MMVEEVRPLDDWMFDAIQARHRRDWPDHETRCDVPDCEICDAFNDRRMLINEVARLRMLAVPASVGGDQK